MGPVLGELLPLAVGVAISPVPIIAVILMLFAPRSGVTSAGFLTGWLVGIAAACGIFVVLGSALGGSDQGEPSTAASWVRLALGVLAVLFALRRWRGRPEPGPEVAMPKWMQAIDSFSPGKAVGLGFVLAAVNPKNLLMAAAAGTAVATGDLTNGEDVVAVVVFTALAGCTVAVPVIADVVAHDRMAGRLESLKSWLIEHNSAVMSVLLVVIGASLIGKGLGGLA